MSEKRPFSHLVVVGSSAGGIEAPSELVSSLPEDFPAPIVAVQHLDPHRKSHLESILERRSTLPVRTLGEHTSLPLESSVVFVVPANRHVNITDSEIHLQQDSAGRPKPSIDLISDSAAEMYGDRLIAVVLIGTGSDGAGARAVKKAGGTLVIQNPETAAHPGMPRSLAPMTVDIVSDLKEIGPILNDLLASIAVSTERDKKKLEPSLEQVRNDYGIDFRSYADHNARLQTILESIPDAVLVVNAVGRTVLTNAAYRRLFGKEDFAALNGSGDLLSSGETPWGTNGSGGTVSALELVYACRLGWETG